MEDGAGESTVLQRLSFMCELGDRMELCCTIRCVVIARA